VVLLTKLFDWSMGVRRRLNNVTRIGVVALACLFPAKFAWSHPHEFVEMKVEVHFDDQKRVKGFEYIWLFDEFFTAYAVEPADEDRDGVPEQAGLDKLIVEIMGNIHPIDYFTKFDTNALVPELANAKPINARMEGRQLRLNFSVPFKEPLELAGKSFSYSIYDDEFYIAMNHSTKPDAVVLKNAPAGCKSEIALPDPDESVREFASSLGKTESGGPDLGYNFAEWVTINCP